MIDLALALCVLLQDPLAEHFDKLREAWKAAEAKPAAGRATGLTDDFIKAIGRLSTALESAGLFSADAPAEARAVKRLLLARAENLMPLASSAYAQRARVVMRMEGGLQTLEPQGALQRFEQSVAKLQDLKARGLDDEDNVQEASVEMRKALKDLGVIHDEMPQWIRRRAQRVAQALVTGGAYPEFQKATPEQEKAIQDLIAQLGDVELEKRESASRELHRLGEPAVPAMREALKSADAEVRDRAKQFLGIGLKDPTSQLESMDPKTRLVKEMEAVERARLAELKAAADLKRAAVEKAEKAEKER
jgi:hypothetical protein